MIEAATSMSMSREMVTFSKRYARYKSLGGVIDKGACQDIWTEAAGITYVDKALSLQADHYALESGVPLWKADPFDKVKVVWKSGIWVTLYSADQVDDATVLYGVLRSGINPEPEFHHSQMCDQRLFAEALRMLGRRPEIKRVIAAYPNIHFV